MSGTVLEQMCYISFLSLRYGTYALFFSKSKQNQSVRNFLYKFQNEMERLHLFQKNGMKPKQKELTLPILERNGKFTFISVKNWNETKA